MTVTSPQWARVSVPWGDPTFERLLAHCSDLSTIDIDQHAACIASVVESSRRYNATGEPRVVR